MRRVTQVALAGVVALALVFGVVVLGGGTALAQGPTPSAPTTPAPQGPDWGQSFFQALANRLGVTLDRLTQAVKDAAKDVVAQSLQAGRVTQDQANQMTQRIDQWQPGQRGLPFMGGGHRGGPGGFGPGGGRGGMMPFGGGMMDAVAQALGVTTADLQTELRSGKTLADIAQAKGVSQDKVKQAVATAMKAQVDQAQQAGRLTADQATQAKQRIDTSIAGWDLTKPMPGFGHDGFGPGFGPGKGGRPGGPNAPGAPTTPATPQPARPSSF